MKVNSVEELEDAVFLVDKPHGWSSFYVIKKLRGMTGVKKMGHAGTLDPLATGLLIICTGKKTKTIESFQDMEKEYEAGITFGATTPTYDSEFPPEDIKDASFLTAEKVETAIKNFVGEIDQTPPIYSAIKLEGKRAYDIARKGKIPEMKSRQVKVHRFHLEEFIHPDYARATIVCSKGTYIRSLVHDLGQVLETGAFLQSLRRTRIGEFRVENAWKIDDFAHLKPQNKIQKEGE